jgi:biopolymer transport protein TolQ
MSSLHRVTEASFVVQAVMRLRLVASVLSWAMIFIKWKVVRRARVESEDFEDRFWSGADLGKLFERVRGKDSPSGMEHIFSAGFRTYARMGKQSTQSALTVTDAVQRSMRVALSREVDALESYMSFLATVGSISPYVGLFGTVWGIMNSFRSLGQVQQATLSAVAPGIAEALIATAIGLFAAIPAVIAYNRFSDDIDRLVNRYDNFLEEFLSLLQRQAMVNAQGEKQSSKTDAA